MKRLTLLPFLTLCTFLVVITTSFPALAQFPERQDERSIDEQLGITQPKEPRQSTGDPKRDISRQYYDECMATPSSVINNDEQDLFCACISEQIYTKMELPDIEAMVAGNTTGQKLREMVRREIFGSCLKYPLREHNLTHCSTSETVRKNFPNYMDVCMCTADMVNQYADIYGEDLMLAAYLKDKNTPDPVGTIINNHYYLRQTGGYFKRCVQIHVLKLP